MVLKSREEFVTLSFSKNIISRPRGALGKHSPVQQTPNTVDPDNGPRAQPTKERTCMNRPRITSTRHLGTSPRLSPDHESSHRILTTRTCRSGPWQLHREFPTRHGQVPAPDQPKSPKTSADRNPSRRKKYGPTHPQDERLRL